MAKPFANNRLSAQKRAILLQAKTDMVIPETVFPNQHIDAVRSALRGLCGRPPHYLFLRPEPLDARRVYYCLTPRGAETVRQRNTYRLGPVWLLAAVVWPTCLALATGPRASYATIPLRVVAGIALGLFLAGLARNRIPLQAACQFWHALVHWFHYGIHEPMPPWMFHSPCGPPKRRRVLTIVAVALFSAPIFGMSSHGLWQCVLVPDMPPVLIEPPADADAPCAQVHAALSQASRLASRQGLLFLALVTACLLVVPPAAFLLTTFLLIGPLVFAYYQACET